MKTAQHAVISEQQAQSLKTLGARLARLRIARRLTQAMAAERAGMSRITVSRIENGEPSVAIGQLVRYLDVLDRKDAVSRLVEPEDDPAVRQLAATEKTRRASPLSEQERGRYDF
jgi:transcriptional regulator with XRE-family HTH domain